MVERRAPAAVEATLDHSFHALSDPTRRKLVELLREAGELTVGDLAAAFEISLNGVSKHLKVLEAADLITRRVEGRQHFIQVNWPSLQAPYEWLHFHHHYWSKRLDALVDYVERSPSQPRTKPRK